MCPTRSAWEIHGREADEVGELFAKFALGSLATMAKFNPQIYIPGQVPHLGRRLAIYQPYFTILLACVVASHLAIFGATVFWMKKSGTNDGNAMQMHPTGEHENESQENLVV